LIPSFAVDYNVKKANGERTDNGRKKKCLDELKQMQVMKAANWCKRNNVH
jgi:hypothetical protein